MKKYTWLSEVIDAMEDLDGGGHYLEISKIIEKKGNIDFSLRKDPVAQVRGTIERYSSDSSVYDKSKDINKEKDIFYSINGIGNGYWGLRNFKSNIDCYEITNDDENFKEGKKILKIHTFRERNFAVIKRAKEKYKQKNGKLVCQICNFDFEKVYGDIGKDFIEAHHIIPVSNLSEHSKTNINDIVLVCSNCHSMLHRKRPWLNIDELKNLIER